MNENFKNNKNMKQIVYFISGHRDITYDQFLQYYVPKIDIALNEVNSKFVVGDCEGVDRFAVDYLRTRIDIFSWADRIEIHCLINNRHLMIERFSQRDERVTNKWKCPTIISEYLTDIERDAEMTRISNIDLAFIGKDRWTSGTAQNILRRYEKQGLVSPPSNKRSWVVEGINIILRTVGLMSAAVCTHYVWSTGIVTLFKPDTVNTFGYGLFAIIIILVSLLGIHIDEWDKSIQSPLLDVKIQWKQTIEYILKYSIVAGIMYLYNNTTLL